MTWHSTVPAALSALLADFSASPGLEGVPVRDGAEPVSSSSAKAVVVGWTGIEGDDTAAETTETMEGLAGTPEREQYQIRCAAMALSGAGNLAAARTQAYALLAACGAAVAADRHLGGVAMRAAMGDHSLHQQAMQRGQRAIVEFMVTVDAYTGR